MYMTSKWYLTYEDHQSSVMKWPPSFKIESQLKNTNAEITLRAVYIQKQEPSTPNHAPEK